MRMPWKKVAMIMLLGLLVVVPLVQVQHAAGQGENAQMISNAKAANEKAAAELHKMMTQMDSMMKMPMSANEKQMMEMMHHMAEIMQMLIDANKNLITIVEHRGGERWAVDSPKA